MRLEQIDHVALRCHSPEATKAWYVSILGFEDVSPRQWAGIPILLRLGSTFVALFPETSNTRSLDNHLAHVAFRAATYSAFEIAQDELRTQGVAFEFQDHEVSHSIYFTDPDGFQLEITTYDLPNVGRASHLPT